MVSQGSPLRSLFMSWIHLDTYQDLLRFEWEKWWPGIVKKWCNSEISYPMECSFPQITIVYMHVVLKGFYPTSWPLLPAYVMAPTRQGSAGLKPLGGSKRGPTLKSQEISLTKGLILLRSKFYSGNDSSKLMITIANLSELKDSSIYLDPNRPQPTDLRVSVPKAVGSIGSVANKNELRHLLFCGSNPPLATMATMAPSVSKVSTPHSRGSQAEKTRRRKKNIAEFPHVAVVTMSHWQV